MHFTLTFESFPKPDGPLRYAPVPWDSKLYGFPFYELRCGDITPEALAQHLSPWLTSLPSDRACLVYAMIPSMAVTEGKVLIQHGFYPVETMLEIYMPLARITPVIRRQSNQVRLRPAKAGDLPRVIAIAGLAFSTDRLHLDPNLPPEKADKRYAQWVERGFRAGEMVFVYENARNSRLIGFFHIRQTSSKAIDLSLAAVDKDYQNSASGVMMYQSVLTECRARGYQIATSRISINNLNVVNVLMRLGFAIRNAVVTMHWFRPKS